MKTTKRQALATFRHHWQEVLSIHPTYRGDSIAKREEWNNYIDFLNKDRQVTDRQASSWSNPF